MVSSATPTTNQQRRAAEEERCVHRAPQIIRKHRDGRHKQRAAQGNPFQNLLNIIRRGIAGPDAGNKTAHLSQIIRQLRGIKRHGIIKVAEENNQPRVDDFINPISFFPFRRLRRP